MAAGASPATAETYPYVAPTTSDPYYTVVVPAGMTVAHIDLFGAQGGLLAGGKGARVQAALAVVPGEELRVFVGGQPADNRSAGGYNGGGESAGQQGTRGHGGGGATDIRRAPYTEADRLAVAGGGGGSGSKEAAGGDSDGVGTAGGSDVTDGKGGRSGSEGGAGGAAGTGSNDGGNAVPGGNAGGASG
ncbi:MAG TPA: glycine-rich protein, partial [Thermoleophilaceae bacterium]|nr:glycine-rich protein [Thermoleophilaceae bacterium]